MKKALVAIISAVLMTAGLVAGTAASATAAEPYPASVGVGNSVTAGAPYQFGRTGAAKPYTVFFAGFDGNRVTGTVFISARKIGTSSVATRAWDFKGVTTRIWSPAFAQSGNYAVTISFVPDDEVYKTSSRSFNLWVTPTGRG